MCSPPERPAAPRAITAPRPPNPLQPPAERLLHYSARPLPRLVNRRQEISVKPRGLWISVEGEQDWLQWCRDEDFNLASLAIVTEIRLTDTARIIRLTSPNDIDAFTRERSAQPGDLVRNDAGERIALPESLTRGGIFMDWPRVAAEYDGIIIAPYIWRRRLSRHCSWYYGWDCASGCVWRASAITLITGK